MTGALDTGVVVIGRNEGKRLVRCLASLAPLGLPVVYVDSGSSDGSVDVARAAGASVVELDRATPFTAARARNEGAETLFERSPSLTYVQFVDGDCDVVPGWIAQARTFLESSSDAAVACGRRRERFPERSIYNRLCDQEWNTPIGETKACGGDALMRVAAFQQARGYDASLIAGEEPELCSRLRAAGWRVWRLDAEMTIHDIAMSRFSQWWRRSVRSGYAYAEITRRGGVSKAVFGPELTRALRWGVFIPLLTIILGLLYWPLFLLGPLAVLLQVIRLAIRRGGRGEAWSQAVLMLAIKYAEAQGVVRYWRSRLARRSRGIIEYK